MLETHCKCQQNAKAKSSPMWIEHVKTEHEAPAKVSITRDKRNLLENFYFCFKMFLDGVAFVCKKKDYIQNHIWVGDRKRSAS